jgi:hypothetical protein
MHTSDAQTRSPQPISNLPCPKTINPPALRLTLSKHPNLKRSHELALRHPEEALSTIDDNRFQAMEFAFPAYYRRSAADLAG